MLTTTPGLGWKVVYPPTLSRSAFANQPGARIFYGERVINFNDGLPKFTAALTEAGGSGTMIEEPAVSGWL